MTLIICPSAAVIAASALTITVVLFIVATTMSFCIRHFRRLMCDRWRINVPDGQRELEVLNALVTARPHLAYEVDIYLRYVQSSERARDRLWRCAMGFGFAGAASACVLIVFCFR